MKTKKMHPSLSLCAAVGCALTLSANATTTVDAAKISQGYSSDNIHQVLGLDDHIQLRAVNTNPLDNGVIKVRYQQYYRGIPVFGYGATASKTSMGRLRFSPKPMTSASRLSQ